MAEEELKVGDLVVFKNFLAVQFRIIEVVPDIYEIPRYNIQSARAGGVIITRVERDKLIKINE